MKSNKDIITTKYIHIGDALRGKSFKNFDELRKKSNELVTPFRDNWMQAVLIKNSVFVNFELMTKREVIEVFEKQNVRILDEEDVYCIYKNDELIGEWSNERRVVITKRGRLAIRVKYVIL
jgi:hypothetical protein